LAKPPSQKPPSSPDDFPQVEPTELFPTNNIRFVIAETAKLIERVDALTRASEKVGDKFDKALDKHTIDVKERIADLKSDVKDNATKLSDMKTSIDAFKGAMKVFGGIYAFVLMVMAAFLAWYLRPAPLPNAQLQQISASQTAAPTKNSN
jgi:hypothetical protein